MLRRLLLSPAASPALLNQVANTIASVPRVTLSRRLSMIRVLRAKTLSLPCPVPYLRGEKDRVVGQRSEDEFVAQFPDCRVERVSGPHLLAQECPEEVARLVLKVREGSAPRS